MRSRLIKTSLISILACLLCAFDGFAQFKEEAFSQNYNDGTESTDSTSNEKFFDAKLYFSSLKHQNTMDVSTSFKGSMLCLGGMQIYNKEYWKLPIVYGGIAGGIGGGLYFASNGNQLASTLCYVGAGLTYWGTLMDGIVNFDRGDWPNPQKATLYSMLLPGLGQIYNKEMWKLPVYWGIMGGSLCYYFKFRENFERFRNIYNSGDTTYISMETAKYYKDLYRRYRDYAVLITAVGYVLQIIDANVFAYMHDFEVSEDISMNIAPTLIAPVLAPNCAYASNSGVSMPTFAMGSNPALGIGVNLKF